ncbi:MAG: transcriptional regulator [Rhizobiales bacterium]|nr:transcriptional regulator [Hyphomicrobiales bacterium]MBA69290.1 transcriptional regulator [Hyphomicrobiales bacterium]|tara:strand:- start:2582 stop:3082 length:501 start_codon:yes stop_codon:yes gene_type:complete
MKLSNGVETGIHCTAVLAGLKGDATLPALALAEYYGVSPTYLLKHLGRLTEAGILESVPGPSGGYRLARLVDDISLLDVVLAIEGPEPAFRCNEIRQCGADPLPADAYPAPCAIKVAMLKAEKAYRAALSETRLTDILDAHGASSDPRVLARGKRFVETRQRPQEG